MLKPSARQSTKAISTVVAGVGLSRHVQY